MAIDKPTRQQLSKVFPNHELMRMFERLFEGVGTNGEYDLDKIIQDISTLENRMDLAEQEIDDIQQWIIDNEQYVVSITSSYTVPSGNYSVIADASTADIVVTLPSAASAEGFTVGVTRIDGSASTVTIESVTAMSGYYSHTLFQHEVINFVSNGTTWELAS